LRPRAQAELKAATGLTRALSTPPGITDPATAQSVFPKRSTTSLPVERHQHASGKAPPEKRSALVKLIVVVLPSIVAHKNHARMRVRSWRLGSACSRLAAAVNFR